MRKRYKRNWIKGVVKRPGRLSKDLGIPVEKNIPMRLLNRIISAKAGQTIKNPTKTGKRYIKVTRAVERRAILARNLKNVTSSHTLKRGASNGKIKFFGCFGLIHPIDKSVGILSQDE